ncbi:MAG: NADH-quinone oxidoreductase subunit M [Planctomycetota bacterium]
MSVLLSVLFWLMVLPLATAAAALAAPERLTKHVAGLGSLASVVLGVVALVMFDWSSPGADQFEASAPVLAELGINFSIAADSVSMLLIALTVFLGPICMYGSFTAVSDRAKLYYTWLSVLQTAMIGVFCARDLALFYVCFEFTLIPMYVLISVFGSSDRKRAATQFFLYTFTGSIVTLAGFAYVAFLAAEASGAWTFDLAVLAETARGMSALEQGWVMLAFLLGFAVKVPLFPVHTWLPLAHTEAPTAGSVILAGVLLKLGTYGIYKFVLGFVPVAVVEYAPLLAVLSIVGIVYAGLICWVQTDVKKLVAYSSVSHLGFCVLGLVSGNAVGVSGGVLYMISHGFSTGALFLMIGMMYERYHTRKFREVGGLASRMPVWSAFMVFFVMASVGLPGLNGFVSEIMCLMGTFQSGADALGPGGTPGELGPWYAAAAGVGMIVAAIYLLFMTGKMVWGEYREPSGHHDHPTLPRDLNAREIALLVPLAAACLVFGVFPKPLLAPIEAPVNRAVAVIAEARERLAEPGLTGERVAAAETTGQGLLGEEPLGRIGDGEVAR